MPESSTSSFNPRIVAEIRQLIFASRLYDVSCLPEGGDIETLFTLK